jgi:hypothetical protein
MRMALTIVGVLVSSLFAAAQGTPPPDPEQIIQEKSVRPQESPESPTLERLKKMGKEQINRAIMGPKTLDLKNWVPLTRKEKFHNFVIYTYAPETFISAGLDAIQAKTLSDNAAYEPGLAGYGQHLGVELLTNETDAFFQRFLFPVAFKQDPRYLRNPDLPFFKRTLYSVSRVVITRSDSGRNSFNASLLLGAAASQAISDIYVPGHQQGLWPIGRRIAFDLAIDSGFNLFYEFWPDLRRKIFHR